MIVMASAMTVAARLLPSLAWRAGFGGMGIHGLGRGGSFGSTPKDTPFQFTNFPLQVLDLFLQICFTLNSPLMLRSPIIGLLTQRDDLEPQATHKYKSEKEKSGKFAKTFPEQNEGGTEVRPEIVISIGFENNCGGNRNERSLLGRKNNQRKGNIGVHAPPIIGSAVAAISRNLK
jgi:hypothetical protein